MDAVPGNLATILIVDDTIDNIVLLSEILRHKYRIKIATSGEMALEIVSRDYRPDLILLDIMMPGMDGYEVCRRLKADPKSETIPLIFLTTKSDVSDEQMGLELGAEDYIAKPISPSIVLARIRNHLHLKNIRDFLRDKNEFLETEVARRTSEVRAIQDVLMVALGSLAETRDNETGNHIRRTQKYIRALAYRARDFPRFRRYLSEETIELLHKSAPLHDIGKVGIPDCILMKPGKLSAEEFEIMKTHTTIGGNAILAAERQLHVSTSFLHFSSEIALYHHERWDGSGYPKGLSGNEIPISALLMGIPDVYDALISKRVYKQAFSHEQALSMIREGSGTQFDPEVVEAFMDISLEFDRIAQSFNDHTEKTS
ncbi:MAG: two-component system response regulator [Spirochaetae bacterium HGW-Spirochaetae-7]|jgi:putative two-component system response regulator|nr:MAG: two-component system response regulator [Spirochaetae bacterium HGW-Spirochaetae-7]